MLQLHLLNKMFNKVVFNGIVAGFNCNKYLLSNGKPKAEYNDKA